MTPFLEIANSVEGWLHGEHPYQFSKFDAMYGDEIRLRRDFIALSEIPTKWQRNIVFRTGEAYQLADQQLLKVCAAARAVIVYDACLAGGERKAVSDETFDELHGYLTGINDQNLPEEEILYQPYELAFPSMEPTIVFRRAGLLAIVGLAQSERDTGVLGMPLPGLPSGQLK